jgi:hypothetical protein
MFEHSGPGPWWEPRRPGEDTALYLGRVLDELGAGQLARRARARYYDDYRCPPDLDDGLNTLRLARDLTSWAFCAVPGDDAATRDRVDAVLAAVGAGEFDGTREEAGAWLDSAEGQATLRELDLAAARAVAGVRTVYWPAAGVAGPPDDQPETARGEQR